MSINNLNIFREIDKQLVNNIKLFYLTKTNLLFATNDDNLFWFQHKYKVLKKFEAFGNNKVIKFECSDCYFGPHYMALTDNGRVYSWGYNCYGQLGDGSRINSYQPNFIESLSEHFITDVSCGNCHTLVLTLSGEVFAFGDRTYGQCGNESIGNDYMYDPLKPLKIEIPNETKVIAISCGYYHSIALTESGYMYVCGSNSWHQLNIFQLFSQPFSDKLKMSFIKKVSCGWMYTLILTFEGDIYFCGNNFSSLSHKIPTKLNSSTKFIDIASTIHSQLCVALSRNNVCYIFGKYGVGDKEVIVQDLKKTKFSKISKTFAFYEQITYKSEKISEKVKFNNYFKNLNLESNLKETNFSDFRGLFEFYEQNTNKSEKFSVKVVKFNSSFRELSLISSGGFSSVFRCEHRLKHKLYAIKKISFQPKDEEIVLKELNILSESKSKFLVKYYDSWIENNYYLEPHSSDGNNQNSELNHLFYSTLRTKLLHIQMELCSLTLRDVINIIIKECKTQTNSLSLIGYYICSELLYEVLECVQYLHQQNPAIIHRDLKPENILLTNNFLKNNRFVKLTDFGLSTFHEFTDQSHSKYKGTKGYKAPEIQISSKYTTKADIYSLGIIILELFQIDTNDEKIENLYSLKSIKKMALSALNATPNLRPDCNRMLLKQNKYRLSLKILSSKEEFKQLFTSSIYIRPISIADNFIEYFIQQKIMNQ